MKQLGFILVLVIASFNLLAQGTISGKLIDNENGEPIIGASVVIEGTTVGAITDFDGKFTFKTNQNPPFVLLAMFLGYDELKIDYQSFDQKLNLKMSPSAVQLEAVDIVESRLTEKQKESPLTVESMDVLAIKETPAANFYEGLGTLKGVDLTSASLGFKIINTRGFNSTSPVRSLQLIDGVDNQSPGLNFSLGNFLGASELDIKRVELVVGASSGIYGPNAFNGVIDMETKSPFDFRGLSLQTRLGERNLREVMFRYADAVENEDGRGVGFKINVAYLTADDWEADNYDPTDQALVSEDNPGGFDAVNIYGDENLSDGANNFNSQFGQRNFPGLGIYYRTGYRETDLVDYDTENLKFNGALHYKFNKKVEAIYSYNFGTGTTVYQGDNRYSLNNIEFWQHRVEVREKGKWFIRAYRTEEDAGDSYDAVFTALLLQDSAQSNNQWSNSYNAYWLQNGVPRVRNLEGYPNPFSPGVGKLWFGESADSTYAAAENVISMFSDSLFKWHQEARAFADSQAATPGTLPYFVPGTGQFDSVFNYITQQNTLLEGGSRFFDRSALTHVQGEYKFEPDFMDITIGGSFRQYNPNSQGTIFSDTNNRVITNREFGSYISLKKRILEEKMILTATTRMDKNVNFDYVFSPAASAVYYFDENNIGRVSFSSAVRNPTLADQYLFYNVGRAILIGNISGFDSLVTIESLQDYFSSVNRDTLEYFNVAPVRPEQVRTLELGYKGTIFNDIFVDASFYYSWYKHFLGFKLGADATFDSTTNLLTSNQVYRVAANSENIVNTAGFSIGLNYYFKKYYTLYGNYSWNRLTRSVADDPIIPAFNTPEHKFNVGISGTKITYRIGLLENINENWNAFYLKNLGFNVNYKWVEGFLFEGSPQFTGFIDNYGLLDGQVNCYVEKLKMTFKVGASNLLNNKVYQVYGGPRVGRMAYFSILLELNDL